MPRPLTIRQKLALYRYFYMDDLGRRLRGMPRMTEVSDEQFHWLSGSFAGSIVLCDLALRDLARAVKAELAKRSGRPQR